MLRPTATSAMAGGVDRGEATIGASLIAAESAR
jgi:hypothetical protein